MPLKIFLSWPLNVYCPKYHPGVTKPIISSGSAMQTTIRDMITSFPSVLIKTRPCHLKDRIPVQQIRLSYYICVAHTHWAYLYVGKELICQDGWPRTSSSASLNTVILVCCTSLRFTVSLSCNNVQDGAHSKRLQFKNILLYLQRDWWHTFLYVIVLYVHHSFLLWNCDAKTKLAATPLN